MKEKLLRIAKIIFVGIIILFFIITIPTTFSNSKSVNQAKDYAKEVLNEGQKICDSNCTDYPTEWEIEKKDELYCMDQCSNNMMKIRQGLIDNLEPTLFKNQYDYRVGQLYCVLGLRCVLSELEDFVYNYKP